MNIKKRNINVDLVKCLAVFLVLSVHFFAHTGLYKIVITKESYLDIAFRTLFMVCVPLFIITTGYLMKDKELSKKYYYGIFRVLMVYIIDGILYCTYYHLCYGEPLSIKHICRMILEFNIGYSWYIEMYIGLFMLIPFLNLIFKNLNTKKKHQSLIITLLILTSLPAILNTEYGFIPEWWIGIYPITYYFIGSYIKEYNVQISKLLNIVFQLIVLEIATIMNIFYSNGRLFNFDKYNDWGSILNVILSSLIFIFVINIDLTKLSKRIKRVIAKVSELSLGIYLTSAIIDDVLYFNYYTIKELHGFLGYIKIVPLVFIVSTGLAIIIDICYKIINKLFIEKYIKPLFYKQSKE